MNTGNLYFNLITSLKKSCKFACLATICCLVILFSGQNAKAQGSNFAGVSPVTLYVCEGNALNFDTVLGTYVGDPFFGFAPDSLIWSVLSNPLHGTLSGFLQGKPFPGISTIYPTGTIYTPNLGFSGIDTFQIAVHDTFTSGITYSFMQIQVVVEPNSPVAGSIYGDTVICMGTTTDTLHDTIPANFYNQAIFPVNSWDGAIVNSNPWLSPYIDTPNYPNWSVTWSSSNPSVATVSYVDSTACIIHPVGPGIATITYTFNNTCGTSTTTKTITVLPSASGSVITGSSTMCANSTQILTVSATGGTWSSSNTALATIDGTGTMYSTSTTGIDSIYYTFGGACGGIDSFPVTISSGPSAITYSGGFSFCQGATVTLNCTPAGGTWSVSNTKATINPVTGQLHIFSASLGLDTVSYCVGSCCVTQVITINVQPTAIFSSGGYTICGGTSVTLSDLVSGGTWSAVDPTIVSLSTISATAAIATGSRYGSTIIYYTIGSCSYNQVLNVDSLPTAILGDLTMCLGSVTTLSDSTHLGIWAGGTWSVASTVIDSVSTSATPVLGIIYGHSLGTTTVTYTVGSCHVTAVTTVNPVPVAIVGNVPLCVGGSCVTFTDASSGGVWTSTNIAEATAGLTTGVICPVAPGNPIITYSTGAAPICSLSTVVTVNPAPNPAITGAVTNCVGGTNITLGNTVAGGLWSTSTPLVDSIGAVSGIDSARTAGTAIVTYSTGAGLACDATITFIINGASSPIASTLGPVCPLSSPFTLTDATLGGTWISSSIPTASIGAATGLVTPGTTGLPNTTTITYNLGVGAACNPTYIVTVNPTPVAISGGPFVLCMGGLTMPATDASVGGTWSSPGVVTSIIAGTGVISAVSTGVESITYTTGVGALCQVTAPVTVNASPSAISGTVNPICPLSTGFTLTDAATGGTWFSTNTSAAIINATTGAVTAGGIPGTSTISYTLGAGASCTVTYIITENPTPLAIGGGSFVLCVGGSTMIATDASAGGTWSTIGSAASINAATGVITASTSGTENITYTTGSGTLCQVTAPVTVNGAPAPISGTVNPICPASTGFTLTDATTGGTWLSTNTSVAVINASTGAVTAGTAGVYPSTSTISYTTGTGASCTVTYVITENATPGAILGGSFVLCVGGSNMNGLNAASGGTWSASNTYATINSSTGIISPGLTPGIESISYTTGYGGGCLQTAPVTVNGAPAPITGDTVYCTASSSHILTDATTGGTWSSSSTTVATIGASSGIVYLAVPAIAGNTIISYTLGAGGACVAQQTVTVNAPPAAITSSGGFTLCPSPTGNTITVADATSGYWYSSNPTVASINTATLVVTPGSISGPAYTTIVDSTGVGSACVATQVITLNPGPGAISPTSFNVLCTSSGPVTFTNPTSGGTWSIAPSGVATLSLPATSGIFTASGIGNAIITYSTGAGCIATLPITVNAPPASSLTSATGFNLCSGGATISLVGSPSGGTWTSSNSTIASVNSSGLVTPGSSSTGLVNINYSTGYGTLCQVSHTVNVNSTISPITGDSVLCLANLTTTLNETTLGGTWHSSNTSVATVSSSGVVYTVGAGTVTISDTSGLGCYAAFNMTINPTPVAITSLTSGFFTMCPLGTHITLSDVSGSGTWTSYSTSIATINSTTGDVSPITTGIAIISYSNGVGSGCAVGTVVTVNPAPHPIVGDTFLCVSSPAVTFTDSSSGGTWSSSFPTRAAITSTGGVVTAGPGVGLVTISYTAGFACSALKFVTVNSAPLPITGSTILCYGIGGSAITLSDLVSGGLWTSKDTTKATIDTNLGSPGIVTAHGIGLDSIFYTTGYGAACRAGYQVSVNAVPNAIFGPLSLCKSNTATYTDATSSGAWSSSAPSIGVINSVSGILFGSDSGIVNVSYTKSGCSAIYPITVNPQPTVITGSDTICLGSSTTLADTIGAGTWASSTSTIASVIAPGIIRGVALGSAVITYSRGTCFTTTIVTVFPVASAIYGTASLCYGGATITLFDTTTGGTWSTSGSIATVSSTGVVTSSLTIPGTTGTTLISYTLSYTLGHCSTTKAVTVHAQPTPIVNTGGLSTVCQGSTRTVSSSPAGGVWTSSSTAIATILPTAFPGVLHGVGVGLDTLTYNVGGFCSTSEVITVNATPSAIIGSPDICLGSTDTYYDSLAGGTWTTTSVINTTLTNIDVNTEAILGAHIGTATITYALNGCSKTKTITVNTFPAVPAAISSPAVVLCGGVPYHFTDATAGGIWSSTDTLVAQVSATGYVTGYAGGVDTISYTEANSCGSVGVKQLITVNPAPTAGAIIGLNVLCNGTVTTLVDTGAAIGFGTAWAASNVSVGTITASATDTTILTAAGIGVDTISFKVTNSTTSCAATAWLIVTVNPLPFVSMIFGDSTLCVGGTDTLIEGVTGGVWSYTVGNVTVDTNGVVSGIVAGNDTVIYVFTNSCGSDTARKSVKVLPIVVPGVISGSSHVCVAASVSLSESVPGGTWVSTNTALATITAGGALFGAIAGLDTIKYMQSNICGTATAVFPITVNPLANAGTISGNNRVCVGDTIILTDATIVAGGINTWTVKNSKATITNSGALVGVIPGVDTIYYSSITACDTQKAMYVDTIKAQPNAGIITGPVSSTVCQGKTITLTDTTSGGVWSSIHTSIATVSASTIAGNEIVHTVNAGTDTIIYHVTNSCGTDSVLHKITVKPAPNAGVLTNNNGNVQKLCVPGNLITIRDTVTTGIWSLSNNTIASFVQIVPGTILLSGVITGYADTVFYIVTNSCGTDTAKLGNGKLDSIYISGPTYMGNPPFDYTSGNYHSICKDVAFTIVGSYSNGIWSLNDSANVIFTVVGDTAHITGLVGGDSLIMSYSIGTDTTADACPNSAIFKLNILDSASFKVSSKITDISCYGDSTGAINLSISDSIGRLKYTWSNNAKTLDNIDLFAGTYWINILDNGSRCKRTDTFKVTQNDSIHIQQIIKNDTCKTGNGYAKVLVSGAVPPYTYLWQFNNNTTDSIGPLYSGVYSVTVTDSVGCKYHPVLDVLEGICNDIIVHNAITPNGDGINDYLTIEGIQDYPENTVQVFDKWGDMVYQKKGYLNEWDGKGSNGETVPDGTYFFVVKLNTVNASGHSNIKTGYILIKR